MHISMSRLWWPMKRVKNYNNSLFLLKYYYPFLVNQIRYCNSKERSWLKEKRINTSFIYTLITYTLRIQFTITMVKINKFTIRPINVSLISIMYNVYTSNFRLTLQMYLIVKIYIFYV